MRLHVCGETFDLAGASSFLGVNLWSDTGLDWSSATSVELALSEPVANEPATGEPAITGVAQDGKTLTADATGIMDDDGVPSTLTYQWVRVDPDGSSNETNVGTGSTYTLTSSDVGSKIRVKVSFNDDGGTDETRTSEAYPSYANVMEAEGDCLDPNHWCATLELWHTADISTVTTHQFGYLSSSRDGDLDPKTFTHGGRTYTVTQVYRSLVTELDGTTVNNHILLFTVTGGTLPDGTVLDVGGQTLTVGTGTATTTAGREGWDLVNLGISFNWVEGGEVAISLKLPNIDATDAPEITGTAQEGETLTATKGNIDDVDMEPDAFPADYTFQWVRVDGGETDITGATGVDYVPVADDVGKTLKVKVSFTDGGGADETRTSAATATVTAATPLPSGCPSDATTFDWCTKLTVERSVLTSGTAYGFDEGNHGDLDDKIIDYGDPPSAVAFTVDRLQIWDADTGTDTVIVRFTSGRVPLLTVFNFGGEAFTATAAHEVNSNAYRWPRGTLTWADAQEVTVWAKLGNFAATGAPTITGTAQVGETLTASTAAIADTDGKTKAESGEVGHAYSYQWLRVSGNTATEITGATNSTYDPVDDDVGKRLQVKVSFTDDDGNDESLTSLATAVVTAAVPLPSGCPMDTSTFDWCTELTVGRSQTSTGTAYGFFAEVYGDLDDETIDYGVAPSAVAYTVDLLEIWDRNSGNDTVTVAFTSGLVPVGTVFDFGGTQFTANAGSRHNSTTYRWDRPATMTWTDAQEVTVWAKLGNFPARGAPTIAGTARVGKTLRASTAAIADTDGKTKANAGETGHAYTYRWTRLDGTGGTEITGATNSTYDPVDADVGKRLQVDVSFTDDGNDEFLVSVATAAVTAASTGTCTAPVVVSDDRFKIWGGEVEVDDIYLSGVHVGHGYRYERGEWGELLPGDNYDNTLRIESKSYRIVQVMVSTSGELSLRLSQQQADSTIGSGKRAKLRLHVCGGFHELGNATYYAGDMFVWSGTGLDWSDDVGALISVALSSSEEPDALPNNAPEFAGQSNDPVVRSVDPRDTEAAQKLGAPVTATDEDGDSVAYSIEDTLPQDAGTSREHAKFFTIGSGTGQLRSAVSFDLLTAEELVFRVKADDDRGGIAYRSVRVELDQTIPAGAPGSAGGLAASSTDTSIDVNLSLTDIGDSSVTHFDVRYADHGEKIQDPDSTLWLAGPQAVDAGPVLDGNIKHRASAVIRGLQPGTEYVVSVRAVNGHGAGGWHAGIRSPNSTTTEPTTQTQTAAEPLTARFEEVPETHDGDPFTVELHFSENIAMTWKTMRHDVLETSGATVTRARRLTQGSEQGWEITVTPASREAAVGIWIAPGGACGDTGAVCTPDGRELSGAPAASIPGPATTGEEDTALTARFTNVPVEHDGATPFTVEIVFSAAPSGMNNRAIRRVVEVAGGAVTQVRRVNRDRAHRIVTVRPDGWGAVTVSLPPTADCADAGALCTEEGGRLEFPAATRIQGPAALSVADAEIDEGPGAVLEFPVTLDRAAFDTVTVDYATLDGTATAGDDYTSTRGTLTFAVGETSKTVVVTVLDDSHDEGTETLTLRLSNATGAYLADAEATGTIENSDAMPAAWLARFGRTVAEQVVEAVESRLRAPPRVGVEAVLAGQSLGLGDGAAAAQARLESLSDWLPGEDEAERTGGSESRTVTARELLTGTSFALAAGSDDRGYASLWGQGVLSQFSGRAGELTLDGEVVAGMLGADWTDGLWTAGLLVAHARATGTYRGADKGGVESDLTGLYPYGRYVLGERVTLWAVAGYGAGTLTLTPESRDAIETDIETDIDLVMAVVGLRGVLVQAPAGGGPEVAAVTDALGVRTSSDAVRGSAETGAGNLAAASGDVTRLRLGLEGTWRGLKLGSGVLTPRLEVGIRHDGGDAETGFGVDVGGGLEWSDPASGIAAELRGRGLLTRAADGFRERGLAGTLTWDPRPDTERGFSLTLRQAVGAAATGGTDALLNRGTLVGLAANTDGDELQRRGEVKLRYGFSAFADRFTATPELGLGLSDSGRDYSLGWRLGLVQGGPTSLELQARSHPARACQRHYGRPRHRLRGHRELVTAAASAPPCE